MACSSRGSSARFRCSRSRFSLPVIAGSAILLRGSKRDRVTSARRDPGDLAGRAPGLPRVFGMTFLVGWASPPCRAGIFALPAGIGDVATGMLDGDTGMAIWQLPPVRRTSRKAAIAWNIFGLLDFTIAIGIALMITSGTASADRPEYSQCPFRGIPDRADPGAGGADLDPAARQAVAGVSCGGAAQNRPAGDAMRQEQTSATVARSSRKSSRLDMLRSDRVRRPAARRQSEPP